MRCRPGPVIVEKSHSRSRMELLVDLLQPGGIDVRVDLRRGDTRVA